MELRDKVAIVTGAGSGFGEAIARAFAAEGAWVELVDLRREQAERVAAGLRGRAIAIEADVSVGAAVEAAVARVTKTWHSPSVVVNNAGFTHKNQSCLEVDEKHQRQCPKGNLSAIGRRQEKREQR